MHLVNWGSLTPAGITAFYSKLHCMQIGLYDCQGPHPSIRYVHTSGEAKGPPTPLGLEEALPLSHLLAPVGACKDCIAAAVDSLEPDMLQHVGSEGGDSSLGTRSFGVALQAVLR